MLNKYIGIHPLNSHTLFHPIGLNSGARPTVPLPGVWVWGFEFLALDLVEGVIWEVKRTLLSCKVTVLALANASQSLSTNNVL